MKDQGLEWKRDIALTSVAIGGSAVYGSSLATAIPGWEPWKGAIWLTVSAGTGWLLLIPSLTIAAKGKFWAVFQACLFAMAVGEVVLTVGATLNFSGTIHGVGLNAAVVAISNVAMILTLSRMLKREGLPYGTTAFLWFLVLDGGGAVAFWMFHRLIFGAAA